MQYIFKEILVLSIICNKCGGNDDKIFKKVSTEIEILGIIDNTITE